MPDPPRLHLPENFLNGLPEIEFLEWVAPLWRIQKTQDPSYTTYSTPEYRFDPPAGQYAITYTNDDKSGTFAEVFLDRSDGVMEWKDGERYLVEITPLHPLPLVDLRSTDTLIDLHLDARISIGDDYEACQKWALAFYSNWAEVCGIRYAPRKANEATSNVALFTERCRSKFTYASLGQLKHLENIVLLATDRYRRLSAEFLAPGSFLR